MLESSFIFRRLIFFISMLFAAAALTVSLVLLLIRVQLKEEADLFDSARVLQLCVDHGGDALRRGDSFISANGQTQISYTYCRKFTSEGEKVKGIVVRKIENGVVTTDWRN